MFEFILKHWHGKKNRLFKLHNFLWQENFILASYVLNIFRLHLSSCACFCLRIAPSSSKFNPKESKKSSEIDIFSDWILSFKFNFATCALWWSGSCHAVIRLGIYSSIVLLGLNKRGSMYITMKAFLLL